MTDSVKVILDLSDDVQAFLEREQIDLYREIQQELPSIKLEVISDPGAPIGSRDLTQVILATVALIASLTPIIIRILNQFNPDIEFEVDDETETHHSDGSTTILRKRISLKREYNHQAQQRQSPKMPSLPKSENSKDTKSIDN
jgi:hypothetical protein